MGPQTPTRLSQRKSEPEVDSPWARPKSTLPGNSGTDWPVSDGRISGEYTFGFTICDILQKDAHLNRNQVYAGRTLSIQFFMQKID